MVLVLAVGCAVGVAPPPGAGATGDTGPEPFVFGRVEVQEATDFCVDWSAVSIPFAASDFDSLVLIEFAEEEAVLLPLLEESALSQEGAMGWLVEDTVGRTTACASELQALGNPFSIDELIGGADRTWVLWLASGEGEDSKLHHPTIVVPTPTSTNHRIVLGNP